MALDLSKDYLVVDDTVSIVYKAKASALDMSTPFTIPYVYREEVIKSQVEPATGIHVRETFFHVWRGPLQTAGMSSVPKRDDLIEHPSGLQWSVREVEEMDLDSSGLPQRFRCRCVTPD
jgi:hypothetical protein